MISAGKPIEWLSACGAALRVVAVASIALLVAACQNGINLADYIENVRTEISGEEVEPAGDSPAGAAAAEDGTQAGSEVAAPPPPEPVPEPSVDVVLYRDDAASSAAARIESEALEAPLPPVVRVGLLLPLTGRYARQGAAILNAAQLALFDIGDEQFRLLPFDTGGTGDGAAAAVEQALAAGVSLLLGPLLREEVVAVAPIAAGAGVRVVAFSTDPDVAGDGVYLIGHTSRQQVARIVGHAVAAGHRRFAALAPDTPYGRAVVAQYREVILAEGAELTRIGFYGADAADAAEVVRDIADYDSRRAALEKERAELEGREDEFSRRALKRLEALHTLGEVDFDAILLPDGGPRLHQVVPLVPYYDIEPAKVRLLGLGLWNEPGTLAEPSLVGAWYVAPPPDAESAFRERYEAAYGNAPLRIAALAYDATALAAALGRKERGADYSDRRLTTPRGFFGAAGAFRFVESGLSERGLAVLEIGPRAEIKVIDAPTRGFASAADN